MPESETETRVVYKRGPLVAVSVIMVVAIVAAIVGFALYATSRVPDGAAAKLNDEYVSETDVNSYINQYRMSHSLTDDTALAQALSSQGMSVAQFRINAIDQIAITKLVNARAEELGITADESKVDEHISQLKSSLAFNDDSIWERTLQQYGTTEDQLREQYRDSLVQQAVCEQEVPRREANDDETLSWAKSNLAGSEQHHYTSIVFSGKNAAKKASSFSSKLTRYEATRSWPNAGAEAKAVKARAKRAGATCSDYAWTIALDSSSELTETLNGLSLGETSDIQTDSSAKTSTIYLCDGSYTFPSSGKIGSLKKKDVPGTLWQAVGQKASDALWSSDCTAYVAKLLAQAKVTYYPVPDDASYNVDLSNTATSSESTASSSESSSGETPSESGAD